MRRLAPIALLALLPCALAEEEPALFAGRIVYLQEASGSGVGVAIFNSAAAKRVVVTVGAEGYRQDEFGTLEPSSMLLRRGIPGALLLDHTERTSARARAN
ncbi:MAG: hypothetical protein HC813_03910, partial [Planctomycetes bacterium]|nr:hypothetical protein [Planctomycetota bacterium]